MKTVIRNAVAATLLGFAINASADLSDVPSGEYNLESNHAYITFTYSHLGFSTPHIGFNSFDASLKLDNENVGKSSVAVTIDATSVDSRIDEFDEHLNGEKFFDTANHPKITFKSTSIASTGDGTYDVVGDLTIKDVTNSVTIPTTLNKAANHPMAKAPAIGFSGIAKLNRSDWGLNEYVPMVGDEVTVHLSIEFLKKTQ